VNDDYHLKLSWKSAYNQMGKAGLGMQAMVAQVPVFTKVLRKVKIAMEGDGVFLRSKFRTM